MISLREVSKRFPRSQTFAVQDLSLDVEAGEVLALAGPHGAGRSTVLKLINRLVEPTSGTVEIAGRSIVEEDPIRLRRRIGYVIRRVGLLPHRSVAANIGTVPELLGWDGRQIRLRVLELADVLGLDREGLARYPSELAPDERVRVGIARALAADPPVVLMDEPFADVASPMQTILQDQFLDLQSQLGKAVVYATGGIDDAIRMGSRIAILNRGVLERVGTANEILRNPGSEFVDSFIGPERGLKRLALITVEEVGIEDAPAVAPSARIADARTRMRASSQEWISVVAEGRLLGWIDEASIDGARVVADIEARPFRAHITPRDTLREALESLVSSRTQVAAVVDEEGRYLGVLSLDRIAEEIVT